MKMLHLADGLEVPLTAVTEKLAFLGRTGSGKSYAAMKLAELMLEAGAQVGVIDPVGVWRGLRVPGAKGGKAFNVVVFGGLPGFDLPLEPTAGALIADVVCDRGLSFVLDISQFIPAEQQRFLKAFVEQFFQRKKAKPSAVHLFLEECQEYIPENPSGLEAATLGAMQRMWKLGRNFGIGGSLISQRPQEIAKKALNMSGTLFAFQMTGPQERKAVKAWVADHGVAVDIERVLQTLAVGQPHVESPTFLQVSKTVRIAAKVTADLSSTPTVGASTAAARPLSPIDVEQLRTAMAETIERAKADDPKELKKRIAALEKDLRSSTAKNGEKYSGIIPSSPKVVEKPVITDAQLARVEALVTKFDAAVAKAAEVLAKPSAAVREAVAGLAGAVKSVRQPGLPLAGPVRNAVGTPRLAPSAAPKAPSLRPNAGGTPPPSGSLTGPEQRIVDAIAWLEVIGNVEPDQVAVAFLAGYTYGAGSFNNPRGSLRQAGRVEYLAGNRIRLTDTGRALARQQDAPPTTKALHEAVLARLPGPEQRLLRPLLQAYPDAMSNEDLAAASSYQAGAGSFNNPKGRLRTLGLVDYPRPGFTVAKALLFLEA